MQAAIFIDGGYWAALMREYFGQPDIDFRKLPAELAEGKPILRTYWYDCLPFMPRNPSRRDKERYTNKQRFLTRLENLDAWTNRLGHLRRRFIDFKKNLDAAGNQATDAYNGLPLYDKCQTTRERPDGRLITYIQKGVDVAFSVDLLTLAQTGQITDAILMTGDNDFLLPVEQSKIRYGVGVTLWFHPNSRNDDLRRKADHRRIIDQAFVDRVKATGA